MHRWMIYNKSDIKIYFKANFILPQSLFPLALHLFKKLYGKIRTP